MMKKPKLFSGLALLWLLAGFGHAQMPSYQYKRSIENISEKGWYAIHLPPAVIAKTSLPLNDLRIYDLSGKDTAEVPYMLEILEMKTERKEQPITILNQSHKQSDTYVTLKAEDRPEVNRIHLELSDRNFDGLVTLEGSMDQTDWFMIKENHRIVRIHNDYISYDYTDIHFSRSNYGFYRLTIRPNYFSRKIKVRGASIYKDLTDQGAYDELMVLRKDLKQDKELKQTEILVQLSQRFLISRMDLALTHEKDYYRRFDAYYRSGIVTAPKGEVEQWVSFYNGVLSSVEENRFEHFRIQSDKIKIVIHNRDDQPLTIQDVKLWGEQVVMKAELAPDRDYALAYGKPNDRAPQYDVIYFEEKIPAELKPAILGPEMICAQPVDDTVQPWFVSTWWIWSIMALVIIILGYFSYQMIRGAKKM